KSHVDHSVTPAALRFGEGSHGSVLSGNYAPTRVSSGWKSTNDKLRLSVRVFGVPMEFGDVEETANGQPMRIPWERVHHSGLLDLHARDVYQLFRCGEIKLSQFRVPRADYAAVREEAAPVLVLSGA